jgi:hypothetical protein
MSYIYIYMYGAPYKARNFNVVYIWTCVWQSGFGGLVVPKIGGSNPAEAVRFFGRKNPQHTFLRRGSKVVCPVSQNCGM